MFGLSNDVKIFEIGLTEPLKIRFYMIQLKTARIIDLPTWDKSIMCQKQFEKPA